MIDPSSLVSGATGAVIVFVLTVLWTEIREARQRTRARMGYTRLLDAEIEANSRALEKIHEETKMSWADLTRIWLDRPPSEEAWTQVREPLASLLKAEDFRTLDAHYRLLGVLLDLKEHPEEAEEAMDVTVWGVSSDLKDEAPRLRRMLAQYANPPRRVRLLGF